jgi:hypothetical protein
MTFSGGATSNIGSVIGGLVPGGQAPGTVVGQETPEWEFPYGQDRVAGDVLGNFFRVDAGPTGLNEYLRQAMQNDPAVISRFRDYIRMGIIRPKNAAARNITTGYGGYQAGDMTALGPMINGMPSGLTESQLNTFANILQTGTQYNLGLLEQMGYFDGMPTLERERVMGELAQGWVDQATQQFLATETQRSNMAQEGLSQQEITNQNIQAMAEIFGGQMTTDPATGQQTFQPTEERREFDVTQSGFLNGQATLTREQQAFNQAKDVANLASNPRNYIEAQMLANARGGLNGMAPNNQVQQTTFGPATTTQQPQFNAPGGAMNQMPTLQTMQGVQGAAGAQAGAQMAMPNQQQAGQPPPAGTQGNYNLNNPDVWQQMMQQAGSQWGAAQPMLDQMRQSQGFRSMMPGTNTPPGPGPGQPPWPGLPAGASTMERMPTMVDDSNWTPEPRQAWEQQSRQASQQAMQERMRLMGQTGQTGQPGVGFQAPQPGQPGQPGQTGASSGLDGGISQQYDVLRNAQQQGQFAGLGSLGQMRASGQSPAQRLMAGRQQGAAGMQDVAGANGPGQQFATSNFTQALMQNRVVPKTGGLSTPGQYMTQGQMGAFNPNKIRTQDYLRGSDSQQKGFNAAMSFGGGYSDEDLSSIMKSNLPTFQAPKAGRMI